MLPLLVATAFLAPTVFFALRLFSTRYAPAQCAAIALAAAAGVFLCSARHEGLFSGLDPDAYAILSDDFGAGLPMVGRDATFSRIPGAIAPNFLFDRVSRPTRDRAYQLFKSGDGFVRRPFYMPAFPLAAAGSGLGRAFVPVASSLFLLALLLGVARTSGARGLVAACAALAVTPYPAWFFRGDFAECAASLPILSCLASAIARPFRKPATFAIAGFAATFPLALHLTALLLAGPIALWLLWDASAPCAPGRRRRVCALALGAAVGAVPLWAFTSLVCAPYGDWTRLQFLRAMLFSATEHAAMAAALCVIVALAVVAGAIASSARLRLLASKLAAGTPLAAFAVVALAPAFALAAMPGPFGGKFRLALCFAVKSIRAPGLVIAALAFASLRPAPRRMAALAVLLCWMSCVFLLVFGVEAWPTLSPPTGVWGFRRLLPPALAFVSLAAFSMPALLRANGPSWLPATFRRRAPAFAGAALAAAAIANPLRSPTAYFAVDGRGSDNFVARTRGELDALGADMVVFDYFPHSVPFAAGGRPVVGLARHGYRNWGAVADWLAGLVADGSNIWFVSSYAMPGGELGFSFGEPRIFTLRQEKVVSKNFLDADIRVAVSTNTLARLVAPSPAQRLFFDRSPVGLRGGWSPARRGGLWSRNGAGFVGPLPQPGEPVDVEFDVEWTPPENGPGRQLVMVDFPGNAYAAALRVEAGRHVVRTNFVSDRPLPEMGVYTVRAPRPFNPGAFGLRGFPGDLGVIFRGVRMKRSASVPRAE
ncbi:MAG: hypothetical protein IKH04_08960 [Kiritimatiellae bacterium]|nr:hypothetical protein [Kiritimatiellia bacterium]